MAVGGALRAALKAADWTKAARESRRRARALADLNLRGGVQGTGQRFPNTSEEFFNRGYQYGVIPPSRMEMANLPLENNGLPFAYTPRNNPPSGRVNYVNPETGARATFAPDLGLPRYGDPIQAPYEGVGVFPNTFVYDFMPQYVGGFPTTSPVPRAFGGNLGGRTFPPFY